MKWRKIAALSFAVMMVSVAAAGCGSNTEESTVQEDLISAVENAREESTETAADTEILQTTEDAQAQSAVTVQVTAVEGDTVTAELGILGGRSMDGAPDGELPDGEKPDGEPPESPDGVPPKDGLPGDASVDSTENMAGITPDGASIELPEGEAPDGGQRGGGRFEPSGETVTFTLTDATVIMVHDPQGSEEGTAEDIAVGSVLEVTLDGDNQAVAITVRNINPVGGGGDEVTEGTER